MGERITKQNLENRCAEYNRQLRGGSAVEGWEGVHVQTQGRYGYVGLDLYRGTSMIDTLTTGSTREVYDYLGAMLKSLWVKTMAAE